MSGQPDPTSPKDPSKKKKRKRKKKRKPGKQTLCRPEIYGPILALVEEAGVPVSTAAAKHGIAHSTISGWRTKGEDGTEPYATFVTLLQGAEASVEIEMAQTIKDFATGIEETKVKRKYVRLPPLKEREDSWSLGQEWRGWESMEGSADKENPTMVMLEEVTETKVKRSLAAATTWLKIRRPDHWTEQEPEQHHHDGPIVVVMEGLPRPGDPMPDPVEIDLDDLDGEKTKADKEPDATGLLEDI